MCKADVGFYKYPVSLEVLSQSSTGWQQNTTYLRCLQESLSIKLTLTLRGKKLVLPSISVTPGKVGHHCV